MSGDTGDPVFGQCEEKEVDYYLAADDFWEAEIEYGIKKAQQTELQDEHIAAMIAFNEAKEALVEAEAALATAQAGNPHQARIDEIEERLSVIEALNVDEQITRLTRIVTGEDPGDVDQAWSDLNFWLGLQQEREDLTAELDGYPEIDLTEYESAVTTATALKAQRDAEASAKWHELAPVMAETTRLGEAVDSARNRANNARARYDEHGCQDYLGDLDEL